ncbi:U11/U12 small nuclear ribonucleoprotein 48 kDa protein [Aristolochia californica]|uniref:U11/U12 small nuclear ribonucleoprotein 48 kDa protein n=1 Tax=Aristolochia californica TaxID=171875 RepID=UPI0035DA4362
MMNPSYPFLNPSLPVLPQTPSSTPTFSFAFPPPQDLPTAISVISEAVDRAECTINRVYELLQSSGAPFFNQDFCSCPFDSRHRMPPQSLFRHSLVCSSSPAVIDLTILDSLRYPSSLKLPPQTHVFKPLEASNTELCFSLDEFGDFGSNFFYKDCPGVVGSTDQDKTFTLPGVLAVECGNFITAPEGGIEDLLILPSELWALRKEIESWNDYPAAYSYTLLRIVSCVAVVDESGIIKQWLIFNSPRRGIVLDIFMRDHIFMLLNVCLKAIQREACRSLELTSRNDGFSNPDSVTFRCPILIEVLTWLTSQLSVLYGETSGKIFVIDMFRQCLVSAASSSLVPVGQKTPKTFDVLSNDVSCGSCNLEVSEGGIQEKLGNPLCGKENLSWGLNKQIYISQVAGAIAALYERAKLEVKIRELRFGRPLSKAQLLDEYSRTSARAIEERGKRTDYRPILEHDGLLWQRSSNQDSAKNKSREELLAEQRDYKRRRMSYRGKKAKRTPTQVIHDIIEEHMEEIVQAGGIGCYVKGILGNGSGTLESVYATEGNVSAGGLQSYHNCFDASRKQSPTYGDDTSTKADYDDMLKYQLRKRSERDRNNRSEQDEHYRFRSPLSYRSHRHSQESYRQQKDPGNVDMTRNPHENEGSVSSRQSKYANSDRDMDKSDRISRSRDRRGRIYQDDRSESGSHNTFEDRYDPLKSYGRYGDAFDNNVSDEKYDKSGRWCSPTKDSRHRKERRSYCPSKRRYNDQDES